jgi:N-acetylglucosaminyl-diphospho-decaprenol L-rhamnosyltransferase
VAGAPVIVAVIVTRNSGEVIGQCLDALASMAPQIVPIVVDNASTDDTLRRVREHDRVHVIANTENRGFAGAVNQGVTCLTPGSNEAEFVLLLNPDVNLLTGVDKLVEASAQYGLASGKLVDLNGRTQAGFTIRRFPTASSLIFELFGINRLWRSNPVNRRYRYLDRNLEEAGEVEQPAGAFLMFRRDVWESLDGMDDSFYPIWFEDVDFCRRAVDAGFHIQYLPEVVANHVGGHSIAKVPANSRAVYWCVSLIRYASKHFRGPAYRTVCAAVVLSSLPRVVAGMIAERSLAPISAYSQVVRFAGLCLVSFRGRGMRNIHL